MSTTESHPLIKWFADGAEDHAGHFGKGDRPRGWLMHADE